jgi:hypothetical protein
MFLRASFLVSTIIAFCALSQPVHSQSGSDSYVNEILAQRGARDEEFRSRNWSALAVTAIAPLDRPKITIGSGPDADLRLVSDELAALHAEVIREPDSGGHPVFRLHATGGKIWSESEPPRLVSDMPFDPGTRVRIGRFLVYWENLGTFGPVIRVLDYSSPAFTRFQGLSYFPSDPAYRLEAKVVPYPKMEQVMIGDTHGWRRPAWKYGEASFVIAGKDLRLVLLLFTPRPEAKDIFFIAFTDTTGGKETYPAARYLQPPFVASGRMILDFNQAINPLCAYNQGFACPLPPRENRLPVAIRAGEKICPHAIGH